MTALILYLTRIIVIVALPIFLTLLILKEASVINVSWLIVFMPLIVAGVMFMASVMIMWLTFVLTKFE